MGKFLCNGEVFDRACMIANNQLDIADPVIDDCHCGFVVELSCKTNGALEDWNLIAGRGIDARQAPTHSGC